MLALEQKGKAGNEVSDGIETVLPPTTPPTPRNKEIRRYQIWEV